MQRPFAALALLVIALTVGPSPVAAQCAFDRPTHGSVANTGTYSVSLVQAFVSCGNPGGNTPNASYQGVPTCTPTETFNQQNGSAATSWRFSQIPGQSWGRLTMNRQSGAFTNPTGVRDTRIRLNLRKIVQTNGTTPVPTGTPGTIALLVRATLQDPVSTSDMTVIDFPINLPFSFTTPGNVTNFSAILGNVMNTSFGFRFPDCTSLEIVSVAILDVNNVVFAVPGIRVIP